MESKKRERRSRKTKRFSHGLEKFKKVITRPGIILVLIFVLLLIIVLTLWLVSLPRDFVPGVIESGLIASSFTDLFSGTGWLDDGLTTLYQDKITTAFTFPLKFEWQKIPQSNLLTFEVNRFVERRDDGSDARCLNGFCLVQKDLKLFVVSRFRLENYEKEEYGVVLPKEINTSNLINLSIGALETKWLVGVVEQGGEGYTGRVYYFNGAEFSEVFEDETLLSSPYEGVFGFGGSDDDFLVIYGAYEGMAYHVRVGAPPRDISRFFGIRLMGGGFQPIALRLNTEQERSIQSIISELTSGETKTSDIAWYIFSLTDGNLKLIKLFQNGTDEIVGVVNFSNLIFRAGVRSAYFALDNKSNKLIAKIKTLLGGDEFWGFTDQGFDKSEPLEIISKNINGYLAEVRRATIIGIDGSDLGANIEFFLSNDGEKWYEVDFGEQVIFPNKEGRLLLWRAALDPKGGSELSPFLDSFRMNYGVKIIDIP